MSGLIDLEDIDTYDFLDLIHDHLVKLEAHKADENKFLDDEAIMITTDGTHKSYDDTDEPSKIEVINDELKTRYKKYHFTGEFDSNQTRFEILSNHLRICTVSYDDTVGKVLLFLLRYIIDGHKIGWIEEYALGTLGDEYPEGIEYDGKRLDVGTYPIEMIVNFMADNCDTYYQVHDPLKDGMYVTSELSGYTRGKDKISTYVKTSIRRSISEVDVWSFYRIFAALGISSNEEE